MGVRCRRAAGIRILKTFILIPARDEAANLPGVVAQLQSASSAPIVVVDDCSLDSTSAAAAAAACVVLRHQERRGVGAAIRTGLAWGRDRGFDAVVTIDGDGQHDASLINLFEDRVSAATFVLGERDFRQESVPTAKLVSNMLGVLLVADTFGRLHMDVSCGYRAFRLEDWLFDIEQNGYGFLHEHLFGVLSHGSDVAKIAVETRYAPDQLAVTRSSEMLGFFRAIEKYASPEVRSRILATAQAVSEARDFVLECQGLRFFGSAIGDGIYVLQTDIARLLAQLADLAD
jgi:glycosyltransferase involved in cell wall biosynthesis